ncbi:MAG: GNAT family N-acetyltransferase [Candidatus Helarchaeota archaeon]|nr:GNAT family N-acetyltransferase [Candidatus Helarchaeota archaeon]
MKVRNATLSDLEDLVALWWEMQSDHFKYDLLFYGTKPEQLSKELAELYFKTMLKNKNHIVIVLDHENKAVGFIHCAITNRPPVLKEENSADLVEVIITQQFRGKGLFQRLCESLKSQLISRNIRLCTLNVEKENIQAVKAYEKCGFKERQKKMVLVLQ